MLSRYFPGRSGNIHVSFYLPESMIPPRSWVLHLPAFAEEMNKCRPMVSRQARGLADVGYAVMVPDLFGTGDSAGEFGEADWLSWKSDLRNLVDWAVGQGAESVVLWGVRTGCLLAIELLSTLPEYVNRVLFWQPVVAGKQYMTQFLRLRVASAMMTGERVTTEVLRGRLKAGESLEIAGYDLSPQMAAQIDAISLFNSREIPGVEINWIEVAGNAGRQISPVAKKAVASLQAKGATVSIATVQGDPFWTTQEIAMAPALIDLSSQLLTEMLYGRTAETQTCLNKQELSLPGFFESMQCQSRQSRQPLRESEGACEMSLTFSCAGNQLAAVFHGCDVDNHELQPQKGVLLVVGGPQYRVGSHRQFVYLARDLAASGIPVLRFDYRGMGDSEGSYVGFEGINEDIRSAIDEFFRLSPGLKSLVIWGLCDAATAASFYGPTDVRVSGLVLLNPWVRTDAGAAKAYLKHYYLQRLFSRDLWAKIRNGSFDPGPALASLLFQLRSAFNIGTRSTANKLVEKGGHNTGNSPANLENTPLLERMRLSLAAFSGKVLFIFSGRDLTSAEFQDAVRQSRKFRKLIRSRAVDRYDLVDADHTFSTREWRDRVSNLTIDWIRSNQNL